MIDLDSLEKLMEARFDAIDKATQLQHKEYERRLDSLNGEAERLRSMQQTYLPRESFEISNREMVKGINNLQSFKDNLQGRMIIIPTVISVVVGILMLLVDYFIVIRR